MPTWRPDQYLKFEQQRTQPCRDLVARITVDDARDIIDLGCGPGNSTAVIAERWPQAKVTGLDSSTTMLEQARHANPRHNWITGDIAQWASGNGAEYDVVLSNAALQWVPDHATVLPRLLARVRPGGVFAIQVPINMDAPANQIARDLASSATWRDHFGSTPIREWFVHDAPFYYDILASTAKKLDIWQTEYLHVMPDVESIGEWYKGTGLRPFLDALSDGNRDKFLNDYVEALRGAYKLRPDGRVLFSFLRLFLIAGN